MIFRPRIFLSSTLNENLTVRNDIDQFFSSVGAETMLYEKNLTPSVNIMTYRKDILDADFIIFIIKSSYGALTDNNISGTHEEFNIALDADIPKHIYIKKENDKDILAQKLIDEINKKQISFYYFSTDNELLKRIKETTFTIAKDIMFKKIENTKLPRQSIKKLTVNYDYQLAISILKHIAVMKNIADRYAIDYVYTTLFDEFMEPVFFMMQYPINTFIDDKLTEKFNTILDTYNKFADHSLDFVTTDTHPQKIDTPLYGDIYIKKCTRCNLHHHDDKYYINIISECINLFNEFKEYIATIKINDDLA